LLDYNDLLISIKKAAMDAVHAEKQTGVVFGSVVSVEPLGVSIDQKLTLGMVQLVLTQSVTTGDGLLVGEKVVMLQMEGGQTFVVLDRVSG